jgi:hypothetical protein
MCGAPLFGGLFGDWAMSPVVARTMMEARRPNGRWNIREIYAIPATSPEGYPKTPDPISFAINVLREGHCAASDTTTFVVHSRSNTKKGAPCG